MCTKVKLNTHEFSLTVQLYKHVLAHCPALLSLNNITHRWLLLSMQINTGTRTGYSLNSEDLSFATCSVKDELILNSCMHVRHLPPGLISGNAMWHVYEA